MPWLLPVPCRFLEGRRCVRAVLLAWASYNVLRCSALTIEGELDTKDQDFATFVGKFCFDYWNATDLPDEESAAGIINVEVTNPTSIPKGNLVFMIFDDERSHWKKIRKSWRSSTCEEKKQAASYVAPMTFTSQREAKMLIQISEKIRPRFWYFAFVGCGLELAQPLKYKVHATNVLWSWQKEFSLDHINLIWVHGFFAVGFMMTTAVTVWKVWWRPENSMLPLQDHPYVKLLLLSYAASLASSVFFLLHYVTFMHDGFGSRRIHFLGVLAGIVANTTMFLIAIMSSVGWAVTTYTLKDHRYFMGGVVLLGGISALVELHSEVNLDQSTRLYSYQSPPGLVALMAKVLMFCWFAFQIATTYGEERQEKPRRYYKFLGVTFTTWSLNVPVMVILAFHLAPWVRFKVVTTVDVASRFAGQALLAFALCGPVSPISRENTFGITSDVIGLEEMYNQLDPVKPGGKV